MITVASLRATLRSDLSDPNGITWPDPSMNAAILAAERAVVLVRNDATAISTEFVCVAGCEQKLDPVLYGGLLDVVRNVGGRVITRVDQETLDTVNDGWMIAPLRPVIREYVMDDRIPQEFYVSPPAQAGAQLKVKVWRHPIPYDNQGGNAVLTVRDEFEPAVKEYALYELLSKDGEDSPAYQQALAHQQAFYNLLGVKMQNDKRNSPKNPEHKR